MTVTSMLNRGFVVLKVGVDELLSKRWDGLSFKKLKW